MKQVEQGHHPFVPIAVMLGIGTIFVTFWIVTGTVFHWAGVAGVIAAFLVGAIVGVIVMWLTGR